MAILVVYLSLYKNYYIVTVYLFFCLLHEKL